MLLGLQSFTTHFTWTQWSGATGQRELWEGGGAQDFKFRAEISIFFSFFCFALGGNSNRIEMFDFCEASECELDPDIGRYVSF